MARPVTQGQAEDLVRRIAARAGLAEPPHVEWVAGHSGRVRPTKTGIRLVLGREILADEEDARFTIAHELGHVVRGHLDRCTVRRTWAWLAGTAGAVLLSMTIAGLTMWGVDGVALAGVAPLAIVLIHRPLIRHIVQPQELEADDFAAQQQCPLSARLAERYHEGIPKEAWWLGWAYPTHPSWSTRAARQ